MLTADTPQEKAEGRGVRPGSGPTPGPVRAAGHRTGLVPRADPALLAGHGLPEDLVRQDASAHRVPDTPSSSPSSTYSGNFNIIAISRDSYLVMRDVFIYYEISVTMSPNIFRQLILAALPCHSVSLVL